MAAANGVKYLKDILKFICTTNKRGYDSWIYDKLNVVAGGNGTCVCEMTITDELLNRGGTLHGGCTATLVDIISTMALTCATEDIVAGVSVDLSVSYLKAGKPGDVIVIDAKTLKAGKQLAFLAVEIRKKADGSLLATGTHTKYIGMETAARSAGDDKKPKL